MAKPTKTSVVEKNSSSSSDKSIQKDGRIKRAKTFLSGKLNTVKAKVAPYAPTREALASFSTEVAALTTLSLFNANNFAAPAMTAATAMQAGRLLIASTAGLGAVHGAGALGKKGYTTVAGYFTKPETPVEEASVTEQPELELSDMDTSSDHESSSDNSDKKSENSDKSSKSESSYQEQVFLRKDGKPYAAANQKKFNIEAEAKFNKAKAKNRPK